ncbi:MAG: glutathione S-transferase family protein, partial [Acidobacteriota bacterium]|nr:glutathione S-transferase family protein [Acidobacteriota bacterium]
MAPELILHHYDFSSFSEKVRLVLGIKGVPWRSVTIPSTLPKPDYMPLTGGYRRAPSLQIGADIYCDSVRIIAELEDRFAEPSIYPGTDRAAQRAFTATLERWTDSILIRTTINYISSLHPEAQRFTPEFLADRADLLGKPKPGLGRAGETSTKWLAQLRPQLVWVNDMLSDGRPYVLGDTISLADCNVYHALWIMDQLAYERVALIPSRIRTWMDRIAAHGHGSFTPMTALDALDIASASEPLPPLPSEVLEGDPAVGTEVSNTPTDTGRANSSIGTLAYIDATRA